MRSGLPNHSLLPFNALVHALSGCLVLWLLLIFSHGSPLYSAALFVINPAAMEWVAQIHRDGVFILGNLMVLASIAQLLDGLKSANIRTMARGLDFAGLAGTLLVWVARPYWIQVLIVIVLLCLLLIGISVGRHELQGMEKNFRPLSNCRFVICLLLFQGWTEKTESPEEEL